MTRIAIVILGLLFAGCNTTSAEAGWPHDYLDSQEAQQKRHYKPVKRYRPKVIYRTVTKTISVPSRCAAPLTREGDQAASESGAMEQADKAWMQAVRWKYGEQFMDITNADDVSHSCGRSSIGSVAGQTFHRCEVTAKPCRAPNVGD